MTAVQCLIIGSGPSGLTAGIYASRANLKPVLLTGLQPGGQLTTTTEVENFPGFPNGIQGPELMQNMMEQAKRLGTDIRNETVEEVDLSKSPFYVRTDNGTEYQAQALIIATGASAKYLGLPSEEKFKGLGVSACATCDGFFYRQKDVAVVGGGDTACEEALYLSGICKKVYLIVRRDVLRASKAMQDRVLSTNNIEVLWKSQTKELLGDDMGLTSAVLTTSEGEKTISIDGFFLAIGHHPNSDVFSNSLQTDEQGYLQIETGSSKTTIPGVFACGDVTDPHYRQAITAAASGCKAALDAERYLRALQN